ncbi:MAG: ABC transporter permease [Chitinispirillaceae bacterium]|nr:ABC transporter permease [Chitinispirillaceae bacterium]
MTTIDLPLYGMAVIIGMLGIPALVFSFLGLPLNRALFTGALRMIVQLTLVGLYLGYIFDLNNIFVNFAWLLVMMAVANTHTIRSAHLNVRHFFAGSFLAILTGTTVILFIFVVTVIRPEPLYDARYLIPVGGMILGNCLRSNILTLERFFSALRKNRKEYQTYLSLGATTFEAALPFARSALSAAVTPTLSTMATMGIVSLPGMMTGQLLGGAVPLIAIKYQVAIMVCILTSSVITATLNILFGIRFGFDGYGNVLERVYQK